MFIREIIIKEFRLFTNNRIKLGRYITAISGFNATGKSTVLGLLGHCGELKRHRPLLQNSFKIELSEILKFSEAYDKKIADIGKIIFNNIPEDSHTKYPLELYYRSTWQTYRDGKRYRIIPKRTTEWNSSAKVTWPTLYLGLGRLYPVGESLKVSKTNIADKLTDNDKRYILDNMKSILNMNEEPINFTAASISETNRKKAVGLHTSSYDYLSNSAGQDNLGQILLAILSFKQLKQQRAENWWGGLLVVDELDAALHPLAQNKLVNFLYKQAKEIDMQIVFTTHSLGLLDYISTKTAYNEESNENNYELIYLTNANGPVKVEQNPSFDTIYRGLMATYQTPLSRRISVFSEDSESRFIINKLLVKYSPYFNLLEVSQGQDQLLSLLVADFRSLSNYIYILDGDVEDNKIEQYTKKVHPLPLSCVIRLPGNVRPEQLFWQYMCNMSDEHPFLEYGSRFGITKRSLEEAGPFSDKYSCLPERDKYKRWFNDNNTLINAVFDFWSIDNEAEINKFIDDFINAYNWIANRCFIPSISKL